MCLFRLTRRCEAFAPWVVMVVLGGAWWCLVVLGGAWWCLVVVVGTGSVRNGPSRQTGDLKRH